MATPVERRELRHPTRPLARNTRRSWAVPAVTADARPFAPWMCQGARGSACAPPRGRKRGVAGRGLSSDSRAECSRRSSRRRATGLPPFAGLAGRVEETAGG